MNTTLWDIYRNGLKQEMCYCCGVPKAEELEQMWVTTDKPYSSVITEPHEVAVHPSCKEGMTA